MIRHTEYPVEATERILAQLTAAGKGAKLRIIWRSTKEGDGIAPWIGVRSAEAENKDFALLFDGCDEDPTDSSHTCPHPILCP